MIGIGIIVMKNNPPMKRLIYIFLSLIAILAIGVIFCNRAVIKTAEDKMYDDVSVIPYNRVGVLLDWVNRKSKLWIFFAENGTDEIVYAGIVWTE